MKRVALVERGDEGDESPEDLLTSDEEEDEAAAAEGAPEAAGPSDGVGEAAPAARKPLLTISLKQKAKQEGVCKACGGRGHTAGFVGATYVDCPNRPCYLCKLPGHTTATCPFRIDPGHGCSPSAAGLGAAAGSSSSGNITAALVERETRALRGRHRHFAATPSLLAACPRGGYQVEAAVLRLHPRRTCCLEFHPRNDSVVISGDKKGNVALWDYDKVHERTVHDRVHSYVVNAVRVLPWSGGGLGSLEAVTASSDGISRLLDLETGESRVILELNPNGYQNAKDWKMALGCDALPGRHAVVVGDSTGRVHLIDPRLPLGDPIAELQLHKRGTKVASVQAHPLDPSVVMTSGNDHCARLFDVRALSSMRPPPAAAAPPAVPPPPPPRHQLDVSAGAVFDVGSSAAAAALSPSPTATPAPSTSAAAAGGNGAAAGAASSSAPKRQPPAQPHRAELAVMSHTRVVNSAYFSPLTGSKVLTTCQDNRLRVWDNWLSCGTAPPDREIVHSHDFNRYLTPFRAEWDPKDTTENVFVVGRYISEDFGGTALHPVDIMHAGTGQLLHQLTDFNLTTICPVNKPHPRRDVIVTGSSGSLYLWTPAKDDDALDAAVEAADGGGAALPGGSGGGQGAASKVPSAADLLRRVSANFVYFDADPDSAAAKKKRRASGGNATTTTATKKGGKRPPAAADDDSDDD